MSEEITRIRKALAEKAIEVQRLRSELNGLRPSVIIHDELRATIAEREVEKLQAQLVEAERRGEERGFNAARRCYRPTNIDAFGPLTYTHETISDWRNSEEYKKGGG